MPSLTSPSSSETVGRAALNVPHTKYDTYFFKGDKYVKVHWTPGSGSGDSIAHGPAKFVDDSPAMKNTGFNQLDCVLPIPGHENRVYVFSGSNYARIDFCPEDHSKEKLHGEAHSIAQNWRSLNKAGFQHVDGALMVPGTKDEAFFFSGEEYCRIRFEEEKFNDELLEGPTRIITGWNAMGFRTIDTVFPRPGSSGDHAYFFSEKDYAQTKVTEYGEGQLVSAPRDVARLWKNSLGKAGFY